MKKTLLLLISLFSIKLCFGQINLVPNPSFEDTVSCPHFTSQINLAVGWMSFRETPDYFNSCSGDVLGVPINGFGHQYAFNGNAYAGFIAYLKTQSNIREYVATELNHNLAIGQKYYVSFWVSLADTVSNNCAINKLGARFTTTSFSESVPLAIDNFSQIHTDSIISNTQNWTRVMGSFIADSPYQYLVIGNFYDDANTDTAFCSLPTSSASYYYLDAVVVSSDSIYTDTAFTFVNEIKFNNYISVYPNPASEFLIIESSSSLNQIELFDDTGKLVCQIEKPEKEVKIDVQNLSNGIYFLTINEKGGFTNEKIIINK